MMSLSPLQEKLVLRWGLSGSACMPAMHYTGHTPAGRLKPTLHPAPTSAAMVRRRASCSAARCAASTAARR